MRLTALLFIAIFQIAGVMASIAMIGKKREPMTSGVVAASFLVSGLMVTAAWILYQS